jgi:hypothetical protein
MKISKIRLFFIIFLLMTFLAGIYVILNPEGVTETFNNNTIGPVVNSTNGPMPNSTNGAMPNSTNGPMPNSTNGPMSNNINGAMPMSNSSTSNDSKNVVNVFDGSNEDPPYKNNDFNEFDPYGQYIGVYTNIDALHDSTKKNVVDKFSDNAMDPNWGGVELTNQSIKTGKYEDNNIYKPMLFQPRTAFIPINPTLGTPKDVY